MQTPLRTARIITSSDERQAGRAMNKQHHDFPPWLTIRAPSALVAPAARQRCDVDEAILLVLFTVQSLPRPGNENARWK